MAPALAGFGVPRRGRRARRGRHRSVDPAAPRANTTLERFSQRSRTFDLIVQGCPPQTDPESIQGVSDTIEQCTNPRLAEQFRQVLDELPGVERTALTSALVVGVLDREVSNHWGRLTLLSATSGPGAPSLAARPIVVDSRLTDPRAAEEVAISEAAARVTRKRVGDVVKIAGWPQSDPAPPRIRGIEAVPRARDDPP